MRVSQEGGDNRGDERGMQERLQGAGPLGVNLVQAVHRLIQSNAQFDFPAHAVEVRDLPRPNPRRQIREEETIALGRVNPDEAEMQGMFGIPHMHIGIEGPAIEHEDLFLQEDIKVGPGELRAQGLANSDGGGIDNVPILDPTNCARA
jgi:hypothetical protein